MNNGFFLRDYRASDLDGIFRLDEACFTREFRFDRKSMQEFAEDRNAVVRVAEKVCGEIAGFVIVHIERIASERRAYVVRQGLAMQLLRDAESRANGSGARWIQLDVFTGNEEAIRFYERMGYERIRTRRGFYGATGLDAFVYGKELSSL